MRSRDDLAAVFRLLEEEVDEHLASVTTPEPHVLSAELPLTAHRSRPRSAKRTVAAALAAAAAVVGIGVGAVYEFGPTTQEQAGFGADTNGLPMQYLIFALKPSFAGQLLRATVGQGGNAGGEKVLVQEAEVFTDAAVYRVHLTGPGVGLGASVDGLRAVDVGGHRGYLGCLRSKYGPNDLTHCNGGAVVWQYNPGAWVQVFAEGPAPTVPELLQMARAVDFASSTPIRMPISLSTAPAGMALSYTNADYQAMGGDARGERPIASAWDAATDYSAPSGERVHVGVGPGPTGAGDKKGAQAITVAGHQAYWAPNAGYSEDPPTSQLSVDAAHDVSITVIAPTTWTLKDFRTFYAGITVTAHPDDSKTWFDASDALP